MLRYRNAQNSKIYHRNAKLILNSEIESFSSISLRSCFHFPLAQLCSKINDNNFEHSEHSVAVRKN